MAAKSAPQPAESGRGRLQRESIVQTALALMNEIGLEALSLRRLADELHVQAPALYWHFKNKQELLDAMAEAMLAPHQSIGDPMPEGDWAGWLMQMAQGLRRVLLGYRDGARLLAAADVSQTSIRTLDRALGVLVGAGFGYQAAFTGIMTVVNYTLGFTFEEQTSPDMPPEQQLELLQAQIESANLEHLRAAFQSAMIPDSDTEFESSMQLLLDGLRLRRA